MTQSGDPARSARPDAHEAGLDDARGGAPATGGDAGGAVDVVDAARVAAVFRVLGDASRCRLVYALLRHDEISVGDLAAMLSMSESNVSHHLSVLRAHGLVRFRREGKQIFYAPDDEHIRLLLDLTLVHVRHGDAGLGSAASGAAR
jgi:ArsR family transcriptional regulator, lead/cadmium/zinc/bismuth-responsive transcriptional repressor